MEPASLSATTDPIPIAHSCRATRRAKAASSTRDVSAAHRIARWLSHAFRQTLHRIARQMAHLGSERSERPPSLVDTAEQSHEGQHSHYE
eukprot:3329033-Rhodomonas_salina.1